MGWLNRMTQFKEKAGKDKEKASVGLYIYPILMAADILLYDATHVPVGEDQKQHLELARDISKKFNLDFNSPEFFKIPEPLIQKNFARVMSLKDGRKKMSKSDPSDLSRINLTDNDEEIIIKIKKAKTDTDPFPENVENLKKRPEIENLVGIYSSLTGKKIENVLKDFKGKNFSIFKDKISDIVVKTISPISKEIKKLNKDISFIDRILKEGSEKADELSSKKIQDIKKKFGF